MSGVSPVTGKPYNEEPEKDSQTAPKSRNGLKLVLITIAILGATGSFLGVFAGMEARWLSFLSPGKLFALLAAWVGAMATALTIASVSAEKKGRLRLFGLALTAALFVAAATAVWLGRPEAIEALKDRAAACERRQAELKGEGHEGLFEAGRAFERSGCPSIMRAAERFTSTAH